VALKIRSRDIVHKSTLAAWRLISGPVEVEAARKWSKA
jgi:hypothetical protein